MIAVLTIFSVFPTNLASQFLFLYLVCFLENYWFLLGFRIFPQFTSIGRARDDTISMKYTEKELWEHITHFRLFFASQHSFHPLNYFPMHFTSQYLCSTFFRNIFRIFHFLFCDHCLCVRAGFLYFLCHNIGLDMLRKLFLRKEKSPWGLEYSTI